MMFESEIGMLFQFLKIEFLWICCGKVSGLLVDFLLVFFPHNQVAEI